MRDLLDRQKDAFLTDMAPPLATRVDRLRRLARLVELNASSFAAAISRDFGTRSAYEVQITEALVLQSEIRHAIRHLARWMKPRRVSVAPAYLPGHAMLVPQPLGVVGIISPWNYPLLLALSPLAGVLSAGNRALLKPSEMTPHFSEALTRAVAETFTPTEVTVVTGDVTASKEFASLPFDHLIFTGSTVTGREVAQAAARNLTPVTLELGGKSPAIIDASCNLDSVIDRLTWGKLINAGQTCIAPDYVLVPRDGVDRFVQAAQRSMRRLYPRFVSNPDYTSIINERHFQRLEGLVDDARAQGATIVDVGPTADDPRGADPAAAGAPSSANRRQLPPKLLLNVSDNMRIMREEIFGPLLPVLPYDSLSDAITYVNKHDRPLALYWFGESRANRDRVLKETLSGGVSINDTLIHLAQNGLPFGGVGPSGYGHYHGEFGFRHFSKQKPVFVQSRFSGGHLIRPPYKPSLARVLKLLSRLI